MYNYVPVEACLGFIKNIKNVDKIVIGINNLEQLKSIVKAFKKSIKFKFIKFNQPSILRKPSKW